MIWALFSILNASKEWAKILINITLCQSFVKLANIRQTVAFSPPMSGILGPNYFPEKKCGLLSYFQHRGAVNTILSSMAGGISGVLLR